MPEVVEPVTKQQLNELSIQIHIAGRAYPLSVKPSEESNLRAAGKLIQEKLNSYQELYSLRDQQDALAMFALESATELFELRKRNQNLADETEQELNQIGQLLRHIQLK